MRTGTKMLMLTRGNETRSGGMDMQQGRSDMRMGYGGMENAYGANMTYGGAQSNYGRSGLYPRRDYDNGMDESMERMEPESRRRYPRRRDGTFAPRSEMRDGSGGEMHYPMPIYEEDERPRMNRIGFEAESDGKRYMGNIVPMRGGEKKLTREMAEEWMGSIQNEDGSKGPKWSMEETKRVMKQKGIEVDPVTFWVVMNALYSDYCNVLKKHNASTVDMYADLACAWIMDKDAVKDKAAAYYEYISKK